MPQVPRKPFAASWKQRSTVCMWHPRTSLKTEESLERFNGFFQREKPKSGLSLQDNWNTWICGILTVIKIYACRSLKISEWAKKEFVFTGTAMGLKRHFHLAPTLSLGHRHQPFWHPFPLSKLVHQNPSLKSHAARSAKHTDTKAG